MITNKIGENAGLIWSALQGGELTTKALKKATKLKELELNMALGWLARESKIAFTITDTETIITLL
ncbi:MAG: winged helix-turn-helix domain-containing protein [Paludibacteraceae bacterium]|nr:winged helix-turn-helix domain-containing protein [Paludibacteraceae bacterium]